jgi:site-specific DNA-methyltransferase (adenine-specific)
MAAEGKTVAGVKPGKAMQQVSWALFDDLKLEPAVLSNPVELDLDIVIKHMDCIEFLRGLDDNSIDILTTDPAYSGMNNKLMLGRGRIVGKYSEKGGINGKWFAEFQDSPENYAVFLAECKRVLKPSGHLYIMFDSFSLLSLGPVVREYFDVKNLIAWDKVNLGMGHYFRRRHEFIIFATNGNNNKISHRSFPDVWRIKRIHNAKYPTQKPVEIFDIMLSASAEKGSVVCDPFLGSGSAAIAAIKRGCNFVGCDVSGTAITFASERTKKFLKNGVDIMQNQSCVPDDEKVFW